MPERSSSNRVAHKFTEENKQKKLVRLVPAGAWQMRHQEKEEKCFLGSHLQTILAFSSQKGLRRKEPCL